MHLSLQISKNCCRPLSYWPPRAPSGSKERRPSRCSFPSLSTKRGGDPTTLVLRALVGRRGGRDARVLIARGAYERQPSRGSIPSGRTKRRGDPTTLLLLALVRRPGGRDARLLMARSGDRATLVLHVLVGRPGGRDTRLLIPWGAALRLPKLRLLGPVPVDAPVSGAERAGEDGVQLGLHLPGPLRRRLVMAAEWAGDGGDHSWLHQLRFVRCSLPHSALPVHIFIGLGHVFQFPFMHPMWPRINPEDWKMLTHRSQSGSRPWQSSIWGTLSRSLGGKNCYIA